MAPARPIPPAGITDFDLENWRDPSQCSEYAQDIFQYYKDREVCTYCLVGYRTQSLLNRELTTSIYYGNK